jgi:hypothetical protein
MMAVFCTSYGDFFMNTTKLLTNASLAALAVALVSPTAQAQTTYSGTQTYYPTAATPQQMPTTTATPAYSYARPAARPSANYTGAANGYSGFMNTSVDPWAPTTARIVSDPLFIPMAGQFYGETADAIGFPTSDTVTNNGTPKKSHSGFSNTATQVVEYGITNNVTARVSDSFLYTEADATNNTGAINTNTSWGFENPTFGLGWRAMDQARYPVDVDLGVSYSPNMISATNPGAGNDGNVASGGQEVDFTAGVGREMNAFTVEGVVSADYLGKRSVEQLGNDTYVNTDPAWQLGAGIDTQTRITDRFSINANGGYLFRPSQDATNPQLGTRWDVFPGSVWDFAGSLNYHFIPNRVVGALTYTYVSTTSSSRTFPNPAQNVSTSNNQNNIFGANIRYLFN